MIPRGALYLVATPIGNLDDITLRAIRVLRDADVVACEDTRHTRGLLAHLGVRTATLSLHEHNERERIPQILDLLRAGKQVALVSDAGTPVVSDPGAALVAAAAREGLPVVPIPGPSAVTAAVGLADFPAAQFAFVGFLPRQRAARRRLLEGLTGLPMAPVLFETPHRLREALADLAEAFGDRRMLLARELTKVHEQVLRGTAAEILAALDDVPRGEVTLVVEGAQPSRGARGSAGEQGVDRPPPELLLKALLAKGLTRRDAGRVLEVVYGMPSRDAYKLAAGDE
jgi:16S rRNA (cytidine1402-2'-O)-methyltransferase